MGQLRTIEIELGKGLGVVDACRKLSITEQTYCRWKKAYRGGPSWLDSRSSISVGLIEVFEHC